MTWCLPAGWFDDQLLGTSSALWFGPRGHGHAAASRHLEHPFLSGVLPQASAADLAARAVDVRCRAELYSSANAETRELLPDGSGADLTVTAGEALFIPAATGTKCARST